MFTHLLSGTGQSVVAILAVVITAAASVAKKWIEETFRTRRLVKSIEDAGPQQRSEIIRACSQLEGTAMRARGSSDGKARSAREPS